MASHSKNGWGLLWRSENSIDGKTEHLMWLHGMPLFFKTREQARSYRHKTYNYIRQRPDLLSEPHGWRYPAVVKVVMTLSQIDE